MAVNTPGTLTLTYEEASNLPSTLLGTWVVGTISLKGADVWNVSPSHPVDVVS